ncbi:MAG: helix-turn-helix domain-containing protein [Firmicutes bacterium]|nr:helix-turn-helix domain-containing protein [Bacillota bacterium]
MDRSSETIKERLRTALTQRGLSQQALAEQTGIPKSSISQYLSGYAKPKQDRVRDMARVLAVNEAWLFGYDVPMEKSSDIVDLGPEPEIPKAGMVCDSGAIRLKVAKKQVDSNEVRLLSLYRSFNQEGKEKALGYLDDLSMSGKYNRKKKNKIDHLTSIAAHERTDIEVTDEMIQHDLNIMLDDDF